MAGRRSRIPGQGMTPLFDLGPPVPPDTAPATGGGGRERAGQESGKATAAQQRSVSSWIRGVFRFGDGTERTRTVEGVGTSARLAEDTARFAAHLRASGWLFPEGRGLLVETLGIAAHDGGLIALGEEQAARR